MEVGPPSAGPDFRFWDRRRLPMYLQSAAAECGLVCLAMLATYWGHAIDVPAMRRRFPISLKGATLHTVARMAEALGFIARPIRLEVEDLERIKVPAILHWEMNHFVVLKSISKGVATLHDPALGHRRVAMHELRQSFTGVALELIPGHEFKAQKKVKQPSVVSLMGPIRGLAGGLTQLLILGGALQLSALLGPFYLQWTVDKALLSGDRGLMTVLALGFAALVVIQHLIGALRSWIGTVLSTNLLFQWFGNVFLHLLRLPLPYFDQRHLGDIVSRFGTLQTIQAALTTQVVEALIDGALVVVSLIAMGLYSIVLASAATVGVMIYALLRLGMYGPLRDATAEMVVKSARQQTIFLESVRGVQTVRLFGRVRERRTLWMNALAEQMNLELKLARISVSYHTANGLLFGLERVLIVWLAASSVLDGALTVGMLFAFLSYKDQFSQRMGALIDKIFDMRLLRVHGARLADILETEPEDALEPEVSTEKLSSRIELCNVSFRYSQGEPNVLTNVSLVLPAGQCLAISGPSGCGKTTLVKIVLGLLKPTSGEVRLGGLHIEKLGLSNYRSLIGSVMQDDSLFAGTISDNISFFDPDPDAARIESCARLASISDEIEAMPMRYLTLIGDLGTGLSGGQKQRVILARALYRSPKVLVLDEATSHLDLVNELTINNAIARLSISRIIVAHRPDTIAIADRVILMDRGEIAHDTRPAVPPDVTQADR